MISNEYDRRFFSESLIPKNQDTIRVMEFLSPPESVNRMVVMSERGLPALAGVVEELEKKFGDRKLFPLNHDAADSNAQNRRNVGWMVRYIMRAYGYTPIARGFPEEKDGLERTSIGKFSNSKFYITSAVYKRTIQNPEYIIIVQSKPQSP